MARVTKALSAKKRHKKVLNSTKGHYGANHDFIKLQSNPKALNIPLEIENKKRVLGHYGFQELRLPQKFLVFLILSL